MRGKAGFQFVVAAVAFAVAVAVGVSGVSVAGSESKDAAVIYSAELDITGPAAVPIFFDLGDERARVRYVPCCNIYGGTLNVERGPDRPMGSAEGLPETLLSSFVTLDPDPLTASTAGLYFRFTYDSKEVDKVLAYEWRGGQWREMLSYEVDKEARTVSFHCPDGGAFVLGTKAGAKS